MINSSIVIIVLLRLIHILLDPVYQVNSGLCSRIKVKSHPPLDNEHAPPQAVSFEDLKKHVFPMLLALGPHAQADPTLLYKVLRICKTALGIKDTGI